MGNEDITAKFDDINIRVDFLIESCQILEQENKKLSLQVKELESQLNQKVKKEDVYVGRESLIQEKINRLLLKLDGFSETTSGDVSK